MINKFKEFYKLNFNKKTKDSIKDYLYKTMLCKKLIKKSVFMKKKIHKIDKVIKWT